MRQSWNGEAITYTPEEGGKEPSPEWAEAVVRQEVRLVLDHPDGGQTEVGLLRDEAWVRAHGARPGSEVLLDMPEMGCRGFARVVAVEPQLVLVRGNMPMVTGTFRHSDGCIGSARTGSLPSRG